MSQNLIDLKNVSVTLTSRAGPVEILRNVSLEIREGEAVSVIGPSGSGKTALLMITAGLERITSGQIMVCGQNLARLNEDGLALLRGRDIGIVFQSFHLVPTMTALENVALPLEFAGDRHPFEKAQEALADVGLAHRHDHFPAQLSGGEQQRVALARALAPKPKLLLADEPTGNLDGKTGIIIMDLIFDLHKKHGTTLMLITHDPKLANRCSTQLSIENGQLTTFKHAKLLAERAHNENG